MKEILLRVTKSDIALLVGKDVPFSFDGTLAMFHERRLNSERNQAISNTGTIQLLFTNCEDYRRRYFDQCSDRIVDKFMNFFLGGRNCSTSNGRTLCRRNDLNYNPWRVFRRVTLQPDIYQMRRLMLAVYMYNCSLSDDLAKSNSSWRIE